MASTHREPRWVYEFHAIESAENAVGGDWESVRGLLGGKGANLADMSRIGVPVPPGFTVTTAACNRYLQLGRNAPDGLWAQVAAALRSVEEQTGRVFGDPANPLLLACRSGAKFSMPGMMDTVLDLGLNDEVAKGMIAATGNERFVLDSYRRLVQMFGSVVLGVDDDEFEDVLADARRANDAATDSELDSAALGRIIDSFKKIIERRAGVPFPSEPMQQLRMAIEAVFDSWDGKRARDYRTAARISDDLGTAVNVMAMVFGNTGENSATGVAMSRNATTGEPSLEGDFLVNAQGEDVVAGIRTTRPIDELADIMPQLHRELEDIARRLEAHHRDMQDMEFTIESGRLWLLQTRDAKRTAQAAVRVAVDLAEEGVISRAEAINRITSEQIEAFLHPRFDPAALTEAVPVTTGLNVSPGAASGVVALDPDLAERWADEGRSVILVRHETKPDDVHGMLAAKGILTASGGRTSHAALVARQFGRPAVVGASDLTIDASARSISVAEWTVREGETISIDGTSGEVYGGLVPTTEAEVDDPWLTELLGWADDISVIAVKANADNGLDAERSRRFGATGIGLCRTEHMFFAPERLSIVQKMIMASTVTERNEAIASLLPFQRADFVDLFTAMDGHPVTIRLLDPPLHEFLPDRDEVLRSIADLNIRVLRAATLDELETLSATAARHSELLAQVDRHREANPMLGTRGVRLGLLIPELTAMQTRAIFEAAASVERKGIVARPEILIPLVSDVEEFIRQRITIQAAAKAVHDELGTSTPVIVGAMVEVPRAALTATAIANYADFVSFGTNDLTQTTFGMSRDDAEAGFLLDYLEQGVLASNPFATLDPDGVGVLIGRCIDDARSVKPGFEAGVCGEHGGDPASIALARSLGVTYVSCSPYRVPVARLAAAHAELDTLPQASDVTPPRAAAPTGG